MYVSTQCTHRPLILSYVHDLHCVREQFAIVCTVYCVAPDTSDCVPPENNLFLVVFVNKH